MRSGVRIGWTLIEPVTITGLVAGSMFRLDLLALIESNDQGGY
jgi:hypothetical protein